MITIITIIMPMPIRTGISESEKYTAEIDKGMTLRELAHVPFTVQVKHAYTRTHIFICS